VGLDPKLAPKDKYEVVTLFWREMKICTEYLHCSHREFLELSKIERVKLLLFEQIERERETYFVKKQLEELKDKGK